MDLKHIGQKTRTAALALAVMSGENKNKALEKIADELFKYKKDIVTANKLDVERGLHNRLPAPLIKRLLYDGAGIDESIKGIRSLISLPDPVGEITLATEMDEDLELYRVTCPIGVIGVVFESRPDALVQISSLCLKSGNGVILKGGSEAHDTNKILAAIIKNATEAAGVNADWIQLLETREEVRDLLRLDRYVDLIIPRGSNEFVKFIMDSTNIPVMGHADGICHCYVDLAADQDMAMKIVIDAKTQYAAVCNALETLLVHKDAAAEFLPKLKFEMENRKVELVGDEKTCAIINVKAATENDWRTEYLDYKLSIKVVSGIRDAINHINKYGSKHTDAIITKDRERAELFMNHVDSANVYWNCSTRFSDGYRYGFGAEVGVSTGKLHARGPVGLDGLLIYKYKIYGNGQVVSDYVEGRKKFTHKPIKTG